MLRSGLCLCAALALASAGCLTSGTVTCADGSICPAGAQCDETHHLCIDQAQRDACKAMADGAACKVLTDGDGACQAGVCLVRGCGDGVIEGNEDCDPSAPDGPFRTGATADCTDVHFYEHGTVTCTTDCRYDTDQCPTPRCGDGVLQADHGEQCDHDAFPSGFLGCTDPSLGFYEPGPVGCTLQCAYETSACRGSCGDGTINGPELCEGTWDPAVGECTDFGHDYGSLGCSLCEPSFSGCGDIGWRRIPGPAGKLGAMTGLTDDDVWVTDGVFVYHWTGATGWITTDPAVAPSSSVRAMWEAPDGDVFAVGAAGQVRHWHAGVWTPESTPAGSIPLDAVAGTSSTDVWAVGDNGVVIHRDFGGWNILSGYGSTTLTGVWTTPAAGVWIVGAGGVAYHDGTPVTVGTADLTAVWGSGPDDVYVADGTDEIWRWNGFAWLVYPLDISAAIVWGSGPRDVYASANDGHVARWDGKSWLTIVPGSGGATGYFGTGPEDVWTAGGGVQRMHGMSWTNAPMGPLTVSDFTPITVYGRAEDDVWVSSGGSKKKHYDGTTWSDVTSTYAFVSAWGARFDDIWFATGETIDHWDGNVWTTAVPAARVSAMWGAGPDDVWALGLDTMHWDGVGWTDQPGPAFPVQGAWGWGPDDVWAVGIDGAASHKDASGWHDMTTATTTTMSAVWGSAPDDVWAVGLRGTIEHWDGVGWTLVPGNPAGGVDLTSVWGSDPTDVWIGGHFGGLFHYDGTLWTPVSEAASGDDIYSLWGTPRRLYAAAASGLDVLDRSARLVPRAHEVACGDAVDDDGDGEIDSDDADCGGAIRLSQVALGSADSYFEVVNRSTETVNLSGLTLWWRLGGQQFTRQWTFPADAIVGPGQHFRALQGADVAARERFLGAALPTGPQVSGWVALCAGACDLYKCSNVIDYYQQAFNGPGVALGCATFSPAPIDVSAAQDGESVTRVDFAGGSANGVGADWTIAPATRN